MVCIVCRFEVEIDDCVMGNQKTGRSICLACFGRETDTSKAMTPELRRQLQAALAGIAP